MTRPVRSAAERGLAVLCVAAMLGGCNSDGRGGPAAEGLRLALPAPGFAVDGKRSDPGRPVRKRGATYNGPIVDVHVHLHPPGRQGRYDRAALEAIMATAKELGVVRLVFLPTPNEGRFRNVENGLEANRALLRSVGGTRVAFLCGSTYLTTWMDEAAREGYGADDLSGRLARLNGDLDSGDCLGIGEIGPYHFEKTPGMAVVHVPLNFPPMLEVAAVAARRGVWIDLHAEPVTPDGRSYENALFGGIALLYRRYPALKLILSHTAMTSPQNARRLLETYRGLMMNLKIVRGRRVHWENLEPITNRDGDVYRDWAALMEEMPERFMVGTDAKFGRKRYPTDRYRKEIKRVRRLLGTLAPAAASLIAHGNAERLWPRPAP